MSLTDVNQSGWGPFGGRGQGGCEPRIEVIVKMQKGKSRGSVGGGGGVRVDVNQELII